MSIVFLPKEKNHRFFHGDFLYILTFLDLKLFAVDADCHNLPR